MARNSGSHILGTAALFVAATIISATMLLVALLLYIADLTGSMLLSLCIVGGASTIVALGLYVGSIKPYAEEMQERIETIYEVSHRVKMGCDWLVKYIIQFFTE